VDGSRALVAEEDADPLWARFYELDGDRPIFGDRDGKVYYDLSEISRERNLGYGWYTEHPYKVQKQFRKWRKKYGL
jgi:PelA/Pel-15E family pectate lyase